MMMKKLCLVFISILQLCNVSAGAQTNDKVKEMAMKIADRILASTTYEFVDKKSGKTYTSLKNMPLNKAVKVRSKYLDWHYTNGVTNIALMELGNKLDNSKYENYVLVSVSAILSCRPFFILIFLLCIKMKHYGFSRKSIWKNLETFP